MTTPARLPKTYPQWLFSDEPIPDPQGRADRMLSFSRLLKHPASADPDQRLGLVDWQERLLRRIYGPSDADGRRQVSTVFVLLPRGNRKTSLGAVMALGHTIGPEARPRGQVILAASARDQARKAYEELREIVKLDDRLKAASRVRDTRSKLHHLRSGSVLEAISADGDAAHGSTPVFVLADELHAWRADRGRKLWAALKTGAAKVAGSLVVIITTAGERPEGAAFDLFKYAEKVATGEVVDPSFLPVLFSAPEDMAWDDEAAWHVANPGLKYGFPDLQGLRNQVLPARALPAQRRAFEIFHLNRWPDGAAAGWVDMSIWDEAPAREPEIELEGRECYVGVDLSKSYDLCAIVAAFPDGEGGYDLICEAFIPDDTLKKRALETDAPWVEWGRAGHLTVTPGAVQDEDTVEAALREWCGRFDVREIAFDPYAARRMMQRLLEDGLPVVEFAQRWSLLSPAVKEFQRAILSRACRHGANPVLRWAVSNVVPVVDDSGNVRFSKKRAIDAIDPAVAAAMAIGRASESVGAPVEDDPWFSEQFDPNAVSLAW